MATVSISENGYVWQASGYYALSKISLTTGLGTCLTSRAMPVIHKSQNRV